MDKYIGTKIIKAEPCLESGGLEGYLVITDGYTSWILKEVFERAYRRTDAMTFGLAIEAMKQNHRVARKGRNGKGMWLRIVIPGGDTRKEDMGMTNLPYIEMKTADDKLVPWLASQTDVLAEDWQVVGSVEEETSQADILSEDWGVVE